MSRRLIGATLAALSAAGCAWGPGAGFGTVAPGTVSTALNLGPGRQDGSGGWKTDNGYRLAVAEKIVRVYVGQVDLLAPPTASAAGTGATFDPAHPPAGYTLCHNGHCHRNDGALIPYEQVQAELSAGGTVTPPRTVLSLTPVTPTLFIPLGGEARLDSFTCGGPTACMLDQGAIARAKVTVTRIEAYGTVEAGPGLPALAAAPVRWQLDLPAPSLSYTAEAPSTIDRTSPYHLAFDGRLGVTEKLFDGIEWDRLAQAAPTATVHLDADAKTTETLLANMAKSQWTAAIKP